MDIRKLLLDIELRRYRNGLQRLGESFHAASKPFLQDIAIIEKEFRDIEEAISRGERTWEIIDEDGMDCGYESDHLLAMISDAEENLMLLRKAFLVLIYHHWERSAQVWLEDLPKKPNHEKIVTSLQKRGFFIPPQLDKLRMIANTIKHNSKCAKELYHSNPEYFNSDTNFTKRTTLEGKVVSKDPEDIDWEGNMHLTNENLDYFIKVALECVLPAPSSAS
ncbi:hypothetical protein [Gluconobacter sp. GP1]|uniref:hypothetical protein n=1 Tax=Gluconobacter sp. GP1 TaxID=3046423 RepID=UPI00293F384F|nr:hypothetical protein [Gluconobacter sp. GP1]